MANVTNPMQNIIFDGVRVVNQSQGLFAEEPSYFRCENVANGIATGDTFPVPSCFQDQTTRTIKN